jgi:hypothetical protein
MAELKTKPTGESAADFLKEVQPASRREDCLALLDIFEKASGCRAEVWSGGIIGYGRYSYRYASGRSGEWMITGFASRKTDLTLYLSCSLEVFAGHLARLGRHRSGKGCVYIKKLADIDTGVLAEMVRISHESMAARNNIYDARREES